MKFKENQIIKHNWLPYPDWICFSVVKYVSKNGITFSNKITINTVNPLDSFLLGDTFLDFSAPVYNKIKIEIIGELKTTDMQIKNLAPEYFL